MITAIEIEVTTSCNWRCNFCPLTFEPKESKAIDLELFRHILDKAVAHKTITTVSINSYNEPTISALFEDYVREISLRGFVLLLHTNGSGLTKERIAFLKKLNVIGEVTFNLPSLDLSAFTELTGSKRLDKSLDAIDRSIAAGFKVGIVVNGTDEEVRANLPLLKTRYEHQLTFPGYNMPTPMGWTNDRCGVLTNKYAQGVNITDARLYGCQVPYNWLYISVDGDLFLCCMDYHQKTIYGNIRDGSFQTLTESPNAKRLYAQVFGEIDAPADFICRKCIYMAAEKHLASK